jgi:hypothetical protein
VPQLPSLEQPFGEASGIKAQRRNITVLFCDMVAIRRHLRRTRYRQITADFDVLQSATQRQHASVVVAMLVISPEQSLVSGRSPSP